jgi:FkbM family methyltransferase
MFIRKLADFATIAFTQGGITAACSWRPFSVASFHVVSRLRRHCPEFNTIIDAGANVGQFARASCMLYPQARVLSIEPLPDCLAELEFNLRDVDRVQTFLTAVGSIDGIIDFYRHEYSQTSSARLGASRSRQHTSILKVPVARLDTLLANIEMIPPILLKLDLQGYELDALAGAPGLLARCDAVLTEAVFTRMYENEPAFADLNMFLVECGYAFERPLHYNLDKYGEIFEIDALFKRRSPRAAV